MCLSGKQKVVATLLFGQFPFFIIHFIKVKVVPAFGSYNLAADRAARSNFALLLQALEPLKLQNNSGLQH